MRKSGAWRGFSSPTRSLKSSFPDTLVARGTTMPKRKPSQRRKPEKTPQQPRDRLAEIRAEIQDVQQQIETQRRDGRVIRTAEDFKSWERAIAALTHRLSALLLAEATQAALTTRRTGARPAPWLKGRATRSRIKADATSRCGRRAAGSSFGRPTSAAAATAARRARGCTRCSCSGACRTAARRPSSRRSASWWRCSVRWRRSSRCCPTVGNRWTSRPSGRSPTVSPRAPGPPSVRGPSIGERPSRAVAWSSPRWRPDPDPHDQARSQAAKGRNRYRTDWREPKC